MSNDQNPDVSTDTKNVSDQPVPASSAHLLTDANVKEILLSDMGAEALLARLKQSNFACKEFAFFCKKIATLESEHSSQMKKAARVMTDIFKKPEIKKGTFQEQVLNIVRCTDRSGDASNNFVDSLHRIHDELIELVKNMDRQRKQAKEVAIRNEKNLLEAENHADKAKSKYDSACEELDRARTGDPNKNKLAFKKVSEEELHKRMTIAEIDYQQKVETVQHIRKELTEKLRVESVRKLQSLILECDHALNLQMLRYANLCETLQLNRGFVISPIKPKNANSSALSMKEMACKIDVELDFYNYVLSVPNPKVPLNRPVVTFRKHPTMQGLTKQSTSPATHTKTTSYDFRGPNTIASNFAQRKLNATPLNISTQSNFLQHGTAKTGPILQPKHLPRDTPLVEPPLPSIPRANANDVPSRTLDSDLSDGHEPISNTGLAKDSPGLNGSQQPKQTFNPKQHGLPVYGTPLEELLDYEEGTVPRVVYQCVQAIDAFGLEVEGIYRKSGDEAQIREIRREFDIDATAVDLLRPNESVNDIHSVACALKQYFQALPDPLLTKEFHDEYLSAASIAADVRRRDTIHAIINKLPDPNYTTLRYLVFHLYRVQERESVNRMSVSNLGMVWGPVLLGSGFFPNGKDTVLESKVIETILINAYAIFEAE